MYIETTVPSYYCDERPEIAADIVRTRQWWDQERDAYECFISAVVLDEPLAGEYPGRSRCLRLIESFAVLAINADIVDIAEVYQIRRLMPRQPVRDALHVACASIIEWTTC